MASIFLQSNRLSRLVNSPRDISLVSYAKRMPYSNSFISDLIILECNLKPEAVKWLL